MQCTELVSAPLDRFIEFSHQNPLGFNEISYSHLYVVVVYTRYAICIKEMALIGEMDRGAAIERFVAIRDNVFATFSFVSNGHFYRRISDAV